MSTLLVALPSPVYRAILQFAAPAIVRLMVERRVVLRHDEVGPPRGYLPEETQPKTTFELHMVERWLADIRSEAFTASAQGQHLIAEWERGR
jgi:hypothetical protein